MCLCLVVFGCVIDCSLGFVWCLCALCGVVWFVWCEGDVCMCMCGGCACVCVLRVSVVYVLRVCGMCV